MSICGFVGRPLVTLNERVFVRTIITTGEVVMPRKHISSSFDHTNRTEPTPRPHRSKTELAAAANSAFAEQPKKKQQRELGEQAMSMVAAERQKTESAIERQRAARLAAKADA
jgi:hypothetical protein